MYEKSLIYTPQNSDYFQKLLEGAKILFDLCEESYTASIVYGSVSYGFYTLDESVTIGDLDFIIPEETFLKILSAVKNDDRFTSELTEYHSLRIFFEGAKLSFHASEHHTPEALDDPVEGVINGVAMRFINKELLTHLYSQADKNGKEEKIQEYSEKYQKLTAIEN